MEFQMHKRLTAYLPDFLKGFREYDYILKADQIEADKMQQRISDLLSDMFVDTATEAGIARREKMYGITPPEGASLEARRVIVKAKEAKSLPYTIRQYREMLVGLCGEGNFKLTLDANAYHLDVKVRVVKATGQDPVALLDSVNELTHQVKPANLVYGSALFDYHNEEAVTYYGAAAVMRKCYTVEVI